MATHSEKRPRISCGRDLHCVPDIESCTQLASVAGFDFVAVPIVHPRFRREFLDSPAKERQGAFTRSDLLLSNHDWSTLVVGKISPWLQPDSAIEKIQANSEKALSQELMFASHLGLPVVMVTLNDSNCINLARMLYTFMNGHHTQQIWVRVPLTSVADSNDDLIENREKGDGDNRDKVNDPWVWWNTLRTICNSHKKLNLALEVTADLPAREEIDRWLGEPIKCIIFPTNTFLTNKKGYPVLSKAHQTILANVQVGVQMMITGTNRHPDKGIRAYVQYLEHLNTQLPPLSTVDHFAQGYEDFLQCPLQPLMDNLESQTYEIFEKDPIKYSQYEKAIYQALLDRVQPSDKDTVETVVMVVGAGRGPLVRAALQAAAKAERKIKVFAVEKNPNAVVTLQSLQDEMWGEQVEVVSVDMRDWEAPCQADILVSELLGSFGDNELSPECLDGAQTYLKADGISIPCKYTSYVAPLSSHKLYNEVRMCKEKDKPPEAHYETPYVVRVQNAHTLGQPKPLFTFVHPNRERSSNARFGTLSFPVSVGCVLHGFAGYFDTVLYRDVTLSIVPQTHSKGMFSWFPIFFPFKEPLYVEKGQNLTIHIWRNCTQKNVWYEWCTSEPVVTPVCNPAGRSYTIGL